jgi:pimeloyl-ACP methyl ester carboxylesterase
MGGPIGQLLWQRHPDLVAGMVLCATAAQFRYGPLGGEHWRLMGLYQMGTRLLPRAWMERALLAQIRGTAPVRLVQSIGPEVADFAPLLPWAVGEVERGDVEDLAEAGRQLGRFDSRGWIGGLDVPTAVVVTTRDRLIPPSIQLQLAGLLPDALVIEVDGDHDAPAGQATAFNQALLQALDHVLDRSGDG